MPNLAEFVADELLRAPMVFDHAIDAVLREWRNSPHPPPGRPGQDPARTLSLQRGDVVQAAMANLRRTVEEAVKPPTAATATPAAESWQLLMQAPRLELSLLDDDAMAGDIALSRTIESIRSHAEFELREFQAYLSSLAGDMYVSRDFNPFRPEAWVQALWQAVQTASLPRPLQAAFMREASPVLAESLRHGYAASTRRLQEAGVVRASHRTIVFAGGARTAVDSSEDTGRLHELRDSMPMPLDGPAVPAIESLVAPAPAPVSVPSVSADAVDPQLIELLSRLFDAMQADRHLPAETQALLLRLHPTVMRAALREPTLLDSYEHAVWRFVDALAFLLDTAPRQHLDRTRQFARGLVDDLVGDAAADVARFEWAHSRLAAFERNLLDRTLAAAEDQIAELAERDGRDAGDTTASTQTLDIGTLDTVPAGLLAADAEPPAVVSDCPVGGWLRAYVQGDWRQLQLLWRGPRRHTWLLLDVRASRLLALRRAALDTLATEGLAGPLKPRSLVRAAAARVLRALSTPPGT
ncbi:MAG: DUF1631 family protein [Aquabacterium sp.]